MVILVVFKGFLVVKNLEILVQIVPEHPIYYYSYTDAFLPIFPYQPCFPFSHLSTKQCYYIPQYSNPLIYSEHPAMVDSLICFLHSENAAARFQ